MNFKVTGKSAAIFFGALAVAAVASTLLNSQYVGLGIMLAVCIYLARSTPP